MRAEPREQRQLLRAHEDVHRVDLDQPDAVEHPAHVAAVDAPGRAAGRRSPAAASAIRRARASESSIIGDDSPARSGETAPMRTRSEIQAQFDLDGRVAIVTGGSRGIGRAIAETYAAAAPRSWSRAARPTRARRSPPRSRPPAARAIAVPTHCGQPRRARGARRRAPSTELGGVDIVVNNAANALGLPIGSITPEAWEASYGVNLRGPLFLFQHALPHLAASGTGRDRERHQRRRVHPRNVPVDVLLGEGRDAPADPRDGRRARRPRASAPTRSRPGTTDTDMVRNNDEAAQQRMVDAALIKRMAAPEEIANGALFLASRRVELHDRPVPGARRRDDHTLKRARRSGRVPCAGRPEPPTGRRGSGRARTTAACRT